MKLCLYLQTRWTAQIGSTGRPSFIISNLPPSILTALMYHMSALAWTKDYFTHESQQTHIPACGADMHAGSLSHPTPKVPALKQFIEASLHGHGFWNSNCYLIWIQVLAPLHLHATLKRPFLRSTCITQPSRSSVNAIILFFFLPHLDGIMSSKSQNNENMIKQVQKMNDFLKTHLWISACFY